MAEICSGYDDTHWSVLSKRLKDGAPNGDESDWQYAVDVFERRIRERFISCIDSLIEADSGHSVQPPGAVTDGRPKLPDYGGSPAVVPGFAIMALACLLIETLQSFRKEREAASSDMSGRTMFITYLQRPVFHGQFTDDVARAFYDGIRNGILHAAKTREWSIRREVHKDRIVEEISEAPLRHVLNRTAFVAALKTDFVQYVQELRESSNVAQRQLFLEGMDRVVARI